MKQQFLSPEKYIQTKARTLPVYKCFISNNWQEKKMASVVVIRRHTNGNLTIGFFLADLLCLGIKDSFYFFNRPETELEERVELLLAGMHEIDYATAHNVIYAAHDFAMDFDIHPHKKFAVTKFILEEDNDDIPLIEIPVGDEDGKPHLMVDNSFNYANALAKLKKNAGEGNYNFTIGVGNSWYDDAGDESTDEDSDWDDEDFAEDYSEENESVNEKSS